MKSIFGTTIHKIPSQSSLYSMVKCVKFQRVSAAIEMNFYNQGQRLYGDQHQGNNVQNIQPRHMIPPRGPPHPPFPHQESSPRFSGPPPPHYGREQQRHQRPLRPEMRPRVPLALPPHNIPPPPFESRNFGPRSQPPLVRNVRYPNTDPGGSSYPIKQLPPHQYQQHLSSNNPQRVPSAQGNQTEDPNFEIHPYSSHLPDLHKNSPVPLPPPSHTNNSPYNQEYSVQHNIHHHNNAGPSFTVQNQRQSGDYRTGFSANSHPPDASNNAQQPFHYENHPSGQSMQHLTGNEFKEEHVKAMTEDQIWLSNWLTKKGLLQHCKRGATKESTVKLTFPEARSLLKESVELLGRLKSSLKQIKEDFHNESTLHEIEKTEEMKARLEEIKCILNNTAVQQSLSMKLEQRNKMRERKKRKRRKDYEAKLELEAKTKQKHKEIDKWLQAISDKIQEEKREKELKTIADKTLQEVNRKMNDVNKGLEVLVGLAKLREVRKDSLQMKGLYPPKDSGPVFQARLSLQREALEKQKKLYEAEKNLLEVMLRTEQEECKEYEEQELERKREDKEQELEQNIREHLFGKESIPEPGDPLYGFWLFYNAADQSMEGLCAIRQQWDCYLTSDASGSSLPPTWVVPSAPTSDAWQSVLKT